MVICSRETDCGCQGVARTHELILTEVHGGSLVGHFGKDKTYMMAKEHYCWPHMLKFIQDIIKRCSTCQAAKSHTLKDYTPHYRFLKGHG